MSLQWIKHLPSVQAVMGSIPLGDSGSFFVSVVDQFTFHALFISLNTLLKQILSPLATVGLIGSGCNI